MVLSHGNYAIMNFLKVSSLFKFHKPGHFDYFILLNLLQMKFFLNKFIYLFFFYLFFFLRIYLLAHRNLLWDILRLPSSRRAALGLYVILTLRRGRGANQPPYALLHRSSPRYALRHGRRRYFYQGLLQDKQSCVINMVKCCDKGRNYIH